MMALGSELDAWQPVRVLGGVFVTLCEESLCHTC